MSDKTADTRIGWTTVVVPNELDAHMTDSGQLDANTDILRELMRDFNKKGPHKIYVPGAGTGQLFASLNHITPLKSTYLFADIREEFLGKLERRLKRGINFSIKVDDVEASKIAEKFDAAVVALLLEHVNWKVALSNILKTEPDLLFVIIQVNGNSDAPVVTKQRPLKPSIKEFAEVASPVLVPSAELESYLAEHGYIKTGEQEKGVADNKVMRGLRFNRN